MSKTDYINPSYRRSDHPSFGEKKHTLLIDNQGASNRDIRTESGTLRFENGVAVLPNDTRARDIYDEMRATEALHPNQYTLVENKPTVNTDLDHRYTFGWNRSFGDAWDRIFEKSKSDSEEEKLDGRPNKSGGCTPQRGAGELHTGS